MRRSLTPLLLAVVVLLMSLPCSTASPAVAVGARVPVGVSVTPDPAHDLYVGTGGLVVPSSRWRSGEAGRGETASCLDCRWRISLLCTKAEFAAGGCRGIDVGCPVGTVPVRIWLLRPGADWDVVGRACQGDERPVTVTDVGSQLRDRAEAALPPLRPAVQPTSGTLVRLPAVFRTGQPARGLQDADLSVLGLEVRLSSRVRWHWDYGDGTDGWTSSPGGTYPDTSVSHAYTSAGSVTAVVTAVWRAQFTVEGLGPFDIGGPALVQRGSVGVTIRPAHAHLVG